MKIAVISSNTLSTPPNLKTLPKGWSTSIHDIVLNITDGMVDRGHDVTLFATGDSKTKAKLEFITETSTTEDPILNLKHSHPIEHILISYCFEKNLTEKYDLIYTYYMFESFIYSQFCSSPVLATIHGPDEPFNAKMVEILGQRAQFISPSNFLAKSEAYKNNCIKTIHHGIDHKFFNYNDTPNTNDLLFVGRLVPEKGPDLAIDLAIECNQKLSIIGDFQDEDYFNKKIKSKIDPDLISLNAYLSQDEVKRHFMNAKAFLYPSKWDEPFGLVIAESMSCGTPVIAFAKGAITELVDDGETGFLVNLDEDNISGDFIIKKTGFEGLKEAIERIYAMSSVEYTTMREKCRKKVEENYTKEIMIDKYEELFKEIITGI